MSLQEGEWEAVKRIWCREEMQRARNRENLFGVACGDESGIRRAGLGGWEGEMRMRHITNSTEQHRRRQGASCLLLFCTKCGACLFFNTIFGRSCSGKSPYNVNTPGAIA